MFEKQDVSSKLKQRCIFKAKKKASKIIKIQF